MVARGRRDDGCEFGMYRNHELGTALLLLHMNGTTAHVLRPHADNVAAALAGVEQQCVRQAGAMATLESRNLVVRPAMMSPGLDPNCFYVAGGSIARRDYRLGGQSPRPPDRPATACFHVGDLHSLFLSAKLPFPRRHRIQHPAIARRAAR